MAPQDGRQPGDIRGLRGRPVVGEMAKRFLHVDGVPVDDCIEGEAQCAELFLLALPKRSSDFAAISVVNAPRQLGTPNNPGANRAEMIHCT